MPTISIFIRKDDLIKWKELENKSQFLHDALENIKNMDCPRHHVPLKNMVCPVDGVKYDYDRS